MDQKTHWNKIAPEYNNEIFDVFNSDREKKLPKYVKKNSGYNKTALDFGCGNGKSFPMLAPLFKHLTAIDISKGLVEQAKTRPFSNISFGVADLAKKKVKLPKVDFVFCCNVIMLPEPEKNIEMFKNIRSSLNNSGKAIIVVPALESAFFSMWQLTELYRNEKTKLKNIPIGDLGYLKPSKQEIAGGLLKIDNVYTKHYSAPELEVICNQVGLKITALEKLNYDWDTEFDEPPKSMQAPYPWDWMMEVEKC